ncbi:MAG: lipid-A-disaccharide synthase [Pseudomonadota bacterium]
MSRPLRIFLVAAEPSGDLLGAALIRALRQRRPDIEIRAVGGAEMANEGAPSLYDISELAVLGIFDGFKIVKLVNERAAETGAAIAEWRADAAVLIDSWGFMIRAAKQIREASPDTAIVKYVGPQVFATRPGRAGVLAKAVDHLLAIHPFDAPYYEPHGLPVTFVGNPALERPVTGHAAAFRARHGLRDDETLALVLFGSRGAEIRRLTPHFAAAMERLQIAYPELRFATVLSPSVADQARAVIASHEAFSSLIVADARERLDAFSAADIALACSGTVTLELARAGVPTVAAYRLGWLSWLVGRLFLMRSKYISLVNIAADDALIPEFVQTRCTGDNLAAALAAFVEDKGGRAALSERLRGVTLSMKGPGQAPSEAAAEALLSIVDARMKNAGAE